MKKSLIIPVVAMLCSISTAALAQNQGLPNPRPTSNTEMPAMPPLPGAQASPPHSRWAVPAQQRLLELSRHALSNERPAEPAHVHLCENPALKRRRRTQVHKCEVELIPLTRRERHLAERAYFANRIELLIRLKRLGSKRMKVREVAVEQLPLFFQEEED